MNRMTELAAEMLDDSHATLWGRAYDLSQPESKAAAAEWFAGEVRKLMGAADVLHYDGRRSEVVGRRMNGTLVVGVVE